MAGNITEVSSVAGSNVSTEEVSATSSTDSSAAPAAAAEDYVVIDKQSAIEAMAYFIAETLMSCPQAASLPPAKLQAAVLVAIQVGWHTQCRVHFSSCMHAAHEQAMAKCHALMQPLDTYIIVPIVYGGRVLWAFGRRTPADRSARGGDGEV